MSDLLRDEFVQAIKERSETRFDGREHKAFIDWYVEAVFGRVKWHWA